MQLFDGAILIKTLLFLPGSRHTYVVYFCICFALVIVLFIPRRFDINFICSFFVLRGCIQMTNLCMYV